MHWPHFSARFVVALNTASRSHHPAPTRIVAASGAGYVVAAPVAFAAAKVAEAEMLGIPAAGTAPAAVVQPVAKAAVAAAVAAADVAVSAAAELAAEAAAAPAAADLFVARDAATVVVAAPPAAATALAATEAGDVSLRALGAYPVDGTGCWQWGKADTASLALSLASFVADAVGLPEHYQQQGSAGRCGVGIAPADGAAEEGDSVGRCCPSSSCFSAVFCCGQCCCCSVTSRCFGGCPEALKSLPSNSAHLTGLPDDCRVAPMLPGRGLAGVKLRQTTEALAAKRSLYHAVSATSADAGTKVLVRCFCSWPTEAAVGGCLLLVVKRAAAARKSRAGRSTRGPRHFPISEQESVLYCTERRTRRRRHSEVA